MHRKLLFFSISAFLCTIFPNSAWGQGIVEGNADALLRAAACELGIWHGESRAEKNALLLEKAQILAGVGEYGRAWEAVERVSRLGLDSLQRRKLSYGKLKYAYLAGRYTEFGALLQEALDAGELPPGSSIFIRNYLAGEKPCRRSEDLALLLSVIPGAGNAYAGDLAGAGKYFLAEGASIALGVTAFASGLYLPAFLGGGILLYSTLPASSAKAVRSSGEYNEKALGKFYAPIFELIFSGEN